MEVSIATPDGVAFTGKADEFRRRTNWAWFTSL